MFTWFIANQILEAKKQKKKEWTSEILFSRDKRPWMPLARSFEHWLDWFEEHGIPVRREVHELRKKRKIIHYWKKTSIDTIHCREKYTTFSSISEEYWTFPMSEMIDLCCRRFTNAIFSSSSSMWSSSCYVWHHFMAFRKLERAFGCWNMKQEKKKKKAFQFCTSEKHTRVLALSMGTISKF